MAQAGPKGSPLYLDSLISPLDMLAPAVRIIRVRCLDQKGINNIQFEIEYQYIF